MAYAEGYIKQGKDKGIKKEVKGYWGDLILSPYYTFGVDSDTPNNYATSLYDIYNKDTGSEQHRHHTVEIAVYNLISHIYEIEYNNIYQMTIEHDIYSGLGNKDSSRNILQPVRINDNTTNSNTNNEEEESEYIEEIISNSVKQINIEEDEINQTNSKILQNIEESYRNIKIYPIVGPTSSKYNKLKDLKFDMMFISSNSTQV
eukprot:CAMPEP_0196763098 /NCGR_PEP_ID=MMETSP1095-20130614/3443_1 /TAXON_ID=96789 ORGANISM="Chromulina nebulosa, Strain UTEXLB2642" /NCGR_SAMPLE_ID=MMETSP1095 /ASSEMBLY_ACC=CAM_ASM_000446 /LENGTH=202 /DNA_ID=CAMNT_0042115609 /DNA_START=182 /DNA_END=786 /DNA_ORIENTATION=+